MAEYVVAIDGRVPTIGAGGVEQSTRLLTKHLVKSGVRRFRFLMLGFESQADWWQRSEWVDVMTDFRVPSDSLRGRFTRLLPQLTNLAAELSLPFARPRIATEDQRISRLRIDLVHFATQGAFLTDKPNIYHPHDLQHLHHPEFFSRRAIDWRDRAYKLFCEQASIVVAMTEWGKRDLVNTLGVEATKVRVIPWPPGIDLQPQSTHLKKVVRARLGLQVPFFFYPAQTWPHKNHLTAIEAIAKLRAKGVSADLVCSGHLTTHASRLRKRADELGVAEYVRFLGYISEADLRVLYEECTALVFPSVFEGWGLPIVEAFSLGTPVLSSNASCLPEVTQGAAELFSPHDSEGLSSLMEKALADAEYRASLVERSRRARLATWDETAHRFLDLYAEVLDLPGDSSHSEGEVKR